MAKRCVVIGAGGHARALVALLIADYSDDYSIEFVGDIAPRGVPEEILGVPVRPLPPVAKLRDVGIVTAFLALGDNAVRAAQFQRLSEAGLELPNVISRLAYVDPSARFGRGTVVGAFAHVGPLVRLGDDTIVNTGANVEHECVVGAHCHLGPGVVLCGRVTVGDGCFFGARSVVIDNRQVAGGARVAAGAVIVKDALVAGALWRGVPARQADER